MLLGKKHLSILSGVLLWTAMMTTPVQAGLYADSSHGDTTGGVDRSTIATGYSAYATGNCAHCHEQHASLDGSEPNPSGSVSAYLGFELEQDLCFSCHDGSPASTDIATQFGIGKVKHPRLTTDGTHRADESTSSDFTGTNRHAECTDCHNPHVANEIVAPGYDATSAAKGPIIGATGVTPSNGAAGVVSSYTFTTVTDTFEQYKVCFKCHSSWTSASRTTANEFNTNNDSYHYVEGDKTYTRKIASTATFNATYVGVMMTRYSGASNATLRTAKMLCSDCHGPGSAGAEPEGVHGSDYAKILKVPNGSPFTTWNANSQVPSSTGATSNVWCFNCHVKTFNGSGFYTPSDGGDELHIQKHDGERCQDCHLANPHGPTGTGTNNQRRHLLRTDIFLESIDDWTERTWQESAHGDDLTALGDNCT